MGYYFYQRVGYFGLLLLKQSCWVLPLKILWEQGWAMSGYDYYMPWFSYNPLYLSNSSKWNKWSNCIVRLYFWVFLPTPCCCVCCLVVCCCCCFYFPSLFISHLVLIMIIKVLVIWVFLKISSQQRGQRHSAAWGYQKAIAKDPDIALPQQQ